MPDRDVAPALALALQGDFVITAITWLPGQVSPIHGRTARGTIVSLHLYGVSAERLTTGINRIYAA